MPQVLRLQTKHHGIGTTVPILASFIHKSSDIRVFYNNPQGTCPPNIFGRGKFKYVDCFKNKDVCHINF